MYWSLVRSHAIWEQVDTFGGFKKNLKVHRRSASLSAIQADKQARLSSQLSSTCEPLIVTLSKISLTAPWQVQSYITAGMMARKSTSHASWSTKKDHSLQPGIMSQFCISCSFKVVGYTDERCCMDHLWRYVTSYFVLSQRIAMMMEKSVGFLLL